MFPSRLRRAPLRLTLCATLCLALSAAGAAPLSPAANPATLPGDDFFGWANGQWLAQTPIPADRNSWGAGGELVEQTNERIRKLIEALAGKAETKGQSRQVIDYYQAMMDEAAIEAGGLTALQPTLQAIAAMQNKDDLARVLGRGLRVDVDPLNNTDFHTGNLFGMWIAQDMNQPEQYAPYLLQGGLGMPDKVYYLNKDARSRALRKQYQQHIAAMLKLAGFAPSARQADKRAAQVMALETLIAKTHADREESEEVRHANNPWPRTAFAQKAPGLNWEAYFEAAQLGQQAHFIVWHPQALKGEAALVGQIPLATWQDWLRFHAIDHVSDALPRAFRAQAFAFHQHTLRGTPQMALRWKQALDSTNSALPDAVGKIYVERYFPPENKARIEEMVRNISTAFGKRIEQLAWMTPATKQAARAKLDSLIVGIGYPDTWQSYDGLSVKPDDALGNLLRSEQFHTRVQIARLGQPVDRREWDMPAQVVNAVNLPLQNALNFPAAILQPPFFDPAADDAANYGATGATIGHEISHSFDDQGAQFDASGRLRNWWSEADAQHFSQASKMLVAQYSAYKPFPDLALNGQLTLSENLADLAGLAAAYDGMLLAQASKPGGAAQIDSTARDQAFFKGYAVSWRNKMRDNALRQRILTDGHSPAPWRTATVRNLDAWYKAFNVQPGQKLYLAPQQRVKVW